MVFYRKYRPQTIEELDSVDVREKLYSVLSSDSIPHAFLFTGPKGLGKTSTARIVAKTVNCQRLAASKLASSSESKKLNAKRYSLDAKIDPCNECDQCVSITNGSNMDVLEIDGASNRGIDEIRDLREKVRLAPTSARKKVYIIDEVHMLTTEAFNALLKTLEEPPAHVMFVFCTTEAHKVPPTILSRCFHIPFKRATDEELVRSFKRIADGEKIHIDDDALSYITSLSDGGFRDGAKILEELSLLAKGKGTQKITITKELIEEKYRVTNIGLYTQELIQALSKNDVAASLDVVQKISELGIDIRYFIEKLISTFHSFLLAKVGIGEKTNGGEGFGINEISRLIGRLSEAHTQTKNAVISQLPLEIAIIEWCETTNNLKQVTNNMTQEASDKKKMTTIDSKLKENFQYESKKLTKAPLYSSNEVRSSQLPASPAGRSASNNNNLDTTSSVYVTKKDTVENKKDSFLAKLIDATKQHNQSLAGVLRGCELGEFGNGKLIIETRFKFHKERLDDPKAVELLHQVAEAISGQKLAISVLLKE